jgi:protein-S-isoprenylcysteine O-methyltransferase Ste14
VFPNQVNYELEGVIMSFMPDFELGLWNAWILILPMIIVSIFGAKVLGKRKSLDGSSVPVKVKTATILYFSIELSSYAYSIFLPLKMGTVWFLVGLLIYVPVMCFLVLGIMSFASTPSDKLVTRGAYSVSRNPSYVSDVLVKTSIGIACLSWLFLLVAILDFILLRTIVVAEEQFLLESYGSEYRDYLNRIPRWIGLPNQKK